VFENTTQPNMQYAQDCRTRHQSSRAASDMNLMEKMTEQEKMHDGHSLPAVMSECQTTA
jgi:hypothetical protein